MIPDQWCEMAVWRTPIYMSSPLDMLQLFTVHLEYFECNILVDVFPSVCKNVFFVLLDYMSYISSLEVKKAVFAYYT